ncbi:hypothetical protein D3C72_1258800 [compost metagenome]
MPLGHHHQPPPAEQRHGDAVAGFAAGGTDDRDVGIALVQPVQRIGLTRLLQVHADLRISLLDARHGRRQHEARLGVGGGQDQLALALAALVGRVGADVVGFGQHCAGAADHFGAGRGDRLQTASLAYEQQEAQFVLQLLELLGQAGLGGMHPRGGERDVQLGVGDGNQVAQLGQRHGKRAMWGRRSTLGSIAVTSL